MQFFEKEFGKENLNFLRQVTLNDFKMDSKSLKTLKIRQFPAKIVAKTV